MSIRLIGMGVLGFALIGSAVAETPLSELDRYRVSFSEAMVDERTAPIVAAYDEQTRVMPEYQETGVGPQSAEDYFSAYFDRFDVSAFEKTEIETHDFDTIVVEIGTFAITQEQRATSERHRWEGTYFDVWERDDVGKLTLVSQAWNYDAPYKGLRELAHFELNSSLPAQRLPGLPIKDRRMYEIRALREMGRRSMMSGHPNRVPLIYADDAMYAPHDRPMTWGFENIRSFLEEYTAFWPPFDFVDTSTDRIDFLGRYVVEHMSYNLRWVGEDQSGVSIGKGIRIWKRSEEGLLQSYRQISMHDF